MKKTDNNYKYIAALFLFICSSYVLAAKTNSAGEIVGTIEGDFRVTPSGAASYSIPLKIPAGLGGMKPELALNYSSQSGNGILGMGWSLSGLSAISRCGSTYAQDGKVRGVKFDTQDKLCLDGQRLVLVSGSYWQSGSEYRTERESFSKIQYQSDPYTGYSYFRVSTKSGLVNEYGNSRDSRVYLPGTGTVVNWSINKSSDRAAAKNSIHYKYSQPVISCGTDTGCIAQTGIQQYLDEITYTHANGLSPTHKVKLHYADSRPDPIVGYFGGSVKKVAKRLYHIDINLLDVNANSTPFKRYKLTYVGNLNLSGQSVITNIQECGFASTSEECVPATQFKHTAQPDWNYTQNGGLNTHVNDDTSFNRVRTGDFNGDGITDIYFIHGWTTNGNVNDPGNTDAIFFGPHIGDNPNLGSPDMAGPLTFVHGSSNNGPIDISRVMFGDFDGDGKLDVYRVGEVQEFVAEDSTFRYYVSDNDSVFLATNFSNKIDPGILVGTNERPDAREGYAISRTHLADFNGDGLTDVYKVTRPHSTHYSASDEGPAGLSYDLTTTFDKLYLSNGDGTFTETNGLAHINYVNLFADDVPIAFQEDVTRLKFGDFDGDGKTDIYIMTRHEAESRSTKYRKYKDELYRRDDQGNFVKTETNQHLWVYAGSNTTTQIDTGRATVVDWNGDGLSDIYYMNGYSYAAPSVDIVYLSKGDGNFEVTSGIPSYVRADHTPALKDIQKISFGDYNGDGVLDVHYFHNEGNEVEIGVDWDGYPVYEYHVSTTSRVYLYSADQSSYTVKDGVSISSVHSNKKDYNFNLEHNHQRFKFSDFNGDGVTDIYLIQGYKEYKNDTVLISNDHPFLVNNIENGLGEKIEINYQKMSGPGASSVYSDPSANDCAYPRRCTPLPIPLVSSHRVDVDDNAVNALFTHHYTGIRFHLRGRGNLGFKSYRTTDELQKISTITQFDNQTTINLYDQWGEPPVDMSDTYPHVGTTLSNIVKSEPNSSVGEQKFTEITYIPAAILINNGQDIQKTYFPVVNEETTREYDLHTAWPVKSTTKRYDYDNYGNATFVSVKVSEGTSQNVGANINGDFSDYSYMQTSNTYGVNGSDDVGKWLGRVSSSIVTAQWFDKESSSGFKQQTRRTDSTYYPDYFLKETIEEATDPNLYLKTTYFYDEYGNSTQINVEGSTAAAYPIETRSTFEVPNFSAIHTTGTNISVTTNAINLSETKEIDLRWGQTKKLVGPNGLPTSWSFDSFGRAIGETRADNSKTITEYHWCNSEAACPANAVYYILTKSVLASNEGQNLTAPGRVYYDRLGREVRKETVGLNGKTVLSDIHYDRFGRVSRESLPYFANQIPEYWTRNQYDIRGRLTHVRNPDSSLVTKQYNGLETTIIRERQGENGFTAIRHRERKNVLGKIEWVTDSLSNYTRYTYYPFGELETTTDPVGNVMLMEYDNRGRKIMMNDPDMGQWFYAHDALGNLRWQKDAKQQIVTTTYDQLNQIKKRVDEASGDVTLWDYYDASAGVGSRGKLASVALKIANVEKHRESFLYDSLGRPTTNTVAMDGKSYSQSTHYDSVIPRISYVEYPQSGGQRLKVKNVYDALGYLKRIICNS